MKCTHTLVKKQSKHLSVYIENRLLIQIVSTFWKLEMHIKWILVLFIFFLSIFVESCGIPNEYVFEYEDGTQATGTVKSGTFMRIACPDGQEFEPPQQSNTIICEKGNITGIISVCKQSMRFPNLVSLLHILSHPMFKSISSPISKIIIETSTAFCS